MRDKIIKNYETSIRLHILNVAAKRGRLRELKELLSAYELMQKNMELDEEEQLIKDLEEQLEYIKEHLN